MKILLILLSLISVPAFAGEPPTWRFIQTKIDADFPGAPTLTIDSVKGRLESFNIIDVRASGEYVVGHLRDARHLMKAAEIQQAYPDKSAPLILYCSVGYRSARETAALVALGYTNVLNLKGSIFEWANDGLPIYRGDKRVQTVHPNSPLWGLLLNEKYHAYQPD